MEDSTDDESLMAELEACMEREPTPMCKRDGLLAQTLQLEEYDMGDSGNSARVSSSATGASSSARSSASYSGGGGGGGGGSSSGGGGGGSSSSSGVDGRIVGSSSGGGGGSSSSGGGSGDCGGDGGSTTALRAAPPCSRTFDDLLFRLPLELQRRCLRFISISNLIVSVRPVSKHFAPLAITEVRERLRGLLHDALVAGFESDAEASREAGSSTDLPADDGWQAVVPSLSCAVEAELVQLHSGHEPVRTLTSRCRSICFNLSDRRNPELRHRLLKGELAPPALVRLTTQEMASGSLRQQRSEWQRKVRRAMRCARARHARILALVHAHSRLCTHTRARLYITWTCACYHAPRSHLALHRTSTSSVPSATCDRSARRATCTAVIVAAASTRGCIAPFALDSGRSIGRARTPHVPSAARDGVRRHPPQNPVRLIPPRAVLPSPLRDDAATRLARSSGC